MVNVGQGRNASANRSLLVCIY